MVTPSLEMSRDFVKVHDVCIFVMHVKEVYLVAERVSIKTALLHHDHVEPERASSMRGFFRRAINLSRGLLTVLEKD